MKPIGSLEITLKLGHRQITHNFHVMENFKDFPFPCIIGLDIIKRHGIIIDGGHLKFWFRDEPSKIYPLRDNDGAVNMIMKVKETSDYPHDSVAALVERTIEDYADVFKTKTEIGPAKGDAHKIFSPNDKPVRSPPISYPPAIAEDIDRQIKELLDRGLIRRSQSPYGCNVVLTEKKNGKYRMSCNYKKLNKDTQRNSAPMHKAGTILRQLPNGYWYTVLDGEGGFWQLRIRPSDIPKTAFYANGRLYEWLVMPYGLKNAPASFVEFMNETLDEYIGKFCFVYMDDIIIFSKTVEEHIHHLKLILQRLREKNFTLNRSKCHIAKRELNFLGHVISQNGIKKQPEKVRAIVDFPVPQNVNDVHRFHGLAMWYASFIPNFSWIAEPLYKLLRKNIEFDWGPAQQEAFERIKEHMTNDVMLSGIDYSKPIYLKTDASLIGIGAVLCQKFNDHEKVIYYASKCLKPRERNLSACERECLAIVWALNKFKELIFGQPIIVITDSSALTYLDNMKGKSAKLTRWSLMMEEFDVKIIYRPGKENTVADALSRAPVPETTDEPDFVKAGKDIMYLPTSFLLYSAFSLRKLQEEQEKDPESRKIIMELIDNFTLNSKNNLANRNYKIIDKVLYRTLKKSNGENPPIGNPQAEQILQSFNHSENGENPNPTEENLESENNSENGENPHHSEQSTNGANPVLATDQKKLLPFIPRTLRREVLQLFHDAPESGHFGVRKTKRAMKNRVYWPNMMQEIREYVKTCDICQTRKYPNQLKPGLLQSAEPPSAVFQTLHMDFIGPLPASSGGRNNKYVLVVVDELSKWPEFFPMRSATAKKVANCLEDQVFCRFGAPKTIVTDNGSQFISKTLKNLCKEWNISHKFISTYHPQANMSERTNRTLKALISSYLEESQREWDLHLQKFALALRSSVSESTKVSPALLNLGREIPLLFDRQLSIQDAEIPIPEDYTNSLKQKLQDLTMWVRSNLEKAHQINKKDYDSHHRDVQYSPNQQILLRTHYLSDKDKGFAAKLAPKWIGPFYVQKQVTPVTYAIMEKLTSKKFQIHHVQNMKPYFPRKQYGKTPTPIPLIVNKRELRNQPRVDYRKLHLGN